MPQDQEVEQDGNMSRLISYRVVPGTNRADHHAFSTKSWEACQQIVIRSEYPIRAYCRCFGWFCTLLFFLLGYLLVWFYAREFDVQMSQHVDSASFAKITLNCPDAVIALKDRLAHDLALNSTAVFEQPSRYESSESLGDMSDIWRWVIANFLIFLIFCLLYQPLVLLITAAFFVCCGLRLEDHICPCENVTVQRFQLAGADFPKTSHEFFSDPLIEQALDIAEKSARKKSETKQKIETIV